MARPKIKDRRRIGDFWTRKARAENYPARSVYKLKEVDQKYKLLKTGARVLDLGCSPGSWLKYAAFHVGPKGLVVGVDLEQPAVRFSGPVRFIKADVFELGPEDLADYPPFDVVLSDMAPRTIGVRSVDQTRSVDLARAAHSLAREMLAPGGGFLVKVFQGPDAGGLFEEIRAGFKIFRRVKPSGSRSFSPEIFGLGLGFTKK